MPNIFVLPGYANEYRRVQRLVSLIAKVREAAERTDGDSSPADAPAAMRELLKIHRLLEGGSTLPDSDKFEEAHERADIKPQEMLDAMGGVWDSAHEGILLVAGKLLDSASPLRNRRAGDFHELQSDPAKAGVFWRDCKQRLRQTPPFQEAAVNLLLNRELYEISRLIHPDPGEPVSGWEEIVISDGASADPRKQIEVVRAALYDVESDYDDRGWDSWKIHRDLAVFQAAVIPLEAHVTAAGLDPNTIRALLALASGSETEVSRLAEEANQELNRLNYHILKQSGARQTAAPVQEKSAAIAVPEPIAAGSGAASEPEKVHTDESDDRERDATALSDEQTTCRENESSIKSDADPKIVTAMRYCTERFVTKRESYPGSRAVAKAITQETGTPVSHQTVVAAMRGTPELKAIFNRFNSDRLSARTKSFSNPDAERACQTREPDPADAVSDELVEESRRKHVGNGASPESTRL